MHPGSPSWPRAGLDPGPADDPSSDSLRQRWPELWRHTSVDEAVRPGAEQVGVPGCVEPGEPGMLHALGSHGSSGASSLPQPFPVPLTVEQRGHPGRHPGPGVACPGWVGSTSRGVPRAATTTDEYRSSPETGGPGPGLEPEGYGPTPPPHPPPQERKHHTTPSEPNISRS